MGNYFCAEETIKLRSKRHDFLESIVYKYVGKMTIFYCQSIKQYLIELVLKNTIFMNK